MSPSLIDFAPTAKNEQLLIMRFNGNQYFRMSERGHKKRGSDASVSLVGLWHRPQTFIFFAVSNLGLFETCCTAQHWAASALTKTRSQKRRVVTAKCLVRSAQFHGVLLFRLSGTLITWCLWATQTIWDSCCEDLFLFTMQGEHKS